MTRGGRRALTVLVAAGLLAGCLALRAPAAGGDLFERRVADLGTAQVQTVVPGFFLGGEVADLAVLDLGPDGGRTLRLFSLRDGAWVQALAAPLDREVQFVDVLGGGDRDRLITFARGTVSAFDPETAGERPLAALAARYDPMHDGEGSLSEPGSRIPRVDVTRDLDGDGRDDLVYPADEGFWVARQAADGSLETPIRLGPADPFRDEVSHFGGRSYGDVGPTAVTIPWSLARVHAVDHDLDGRVDLVFWADGRLRVHRLGADGRWAAMPAVVDCDVPVDLEGAHALLLGLGDESPARALLGLRAKEQRTLLHAIRDLDGDGVADLVTVTLEGRSLVKQRGIWAVHRGRATAGGVRFAAAPTTSVRPRGRAAGMTAAGYASQVFEDFDGDGQVDVLFREVPLGFGAMTQASVGKSIPLDVELYRLRAGRDPDGPAAVRKVRRFAPFEGSDDVFFPAMAVGDLDGDGRLDLLVGAEPRALEVHFGVPGGALLADGARRVEVALPADERRLRLFDLDRDGRQELLVHQPPPREAPDAPHRVTTLFAR